MKFVLILMFYFPTTGTIQSVQTAEFDDKPACEAAYGVAQTMTLGIGDKNSLRHECVPKATARAGKK